MKKINMGLWASLVSFEVWDFATPVQIRVAPLNNTTKLKKMTTKLKKTKSAGRFGARYGKTVKARLVKVEEKQRVRQTCPLCKKLGAKRISKGIWNCPKCDKKFASNTYHLD
ncbi:MAG: 50S ribosomal protein L37Ae [archaeon GW2011_AR13]|nr:MAG: 50S ribosomal protein L37Ae [archaeon GW2011_AR13]